MRGVCGVFATHFHGIRSHRLLRRILPAAVCALLLVFPQVLRADTVQEADLSATLLAAVKSATGAEPVFPLQDDDPFFQPAALDISGRSVTSLKGIRFFRELTSLTAERNKISSLKDIVFPDRIRFLSLAHNSIADLSAAVWPAGLHTLDLRNNRLTSPLMASFPDVIASIALDNNFLTSKYFSAPSGAAVSYDGNFIYEANTVRPASLVVKDISSVTLSPGEQRAIPFVNITSSTNPNNQVPPSLITASLNIAYNSPAQLMREEYRFLLSAAQDGTDYLEVRLALTDYQIRQHENMNRTFYKVLIPITVWQSAENRPEAAAANNGDAAIQSALSGFSTNAVVDITRFADGSAIFSPGLLAQLAGQDQSLILSHDFGNITIDPKNLAHIARQAGVSASATVQLTLTAYDIRAAGFSPSRFSDKEIFILPYKDFYFSAQLRVPGAAARELELGSPVPVVLYLSSQRFTAWDFGHLVAFKDHGSALDLLGGVYNAANGSFSYLLSGGGRYGLGTRGTLVQWVDLAINSTQIIHSDGAVSTVNPAPLIYRGATMVPLRSVFEKIGASVTWHEAIRSATISYGDKTIYITEGRSISGSDQTPYVINGRMLVPLRYITTEFGATVIWWGQSGRIRIVY